MLVAQELGMGHHLRTAPPETVGPLLFTSVKRTEVRLTHYRGPIVGQEKRRRPGTGLSFVHSDSVPADAPIPLPVRPDMLVCFSWKPRCHTGASFFPPAANPMSRR